MYIYISHPPYSRFALLNDILIYQLSLFSAKTILVEEVVVLFN